MRRKISTASRWNQRLRGLHDGYPRPNSKLECRCRTHQGLHSRTKLFGRNFSCFFPPKDIERGLPKEILRITAVNGRHEEQGMRVRSDGSRFFASVTFTALRNKKGKLKGFSEFSHDLKLSESKE